MTSAIHKKILAKYGESILKRSALSIRDGAGVFEYMLQGKGYRTVLEIGTYRGVSAAEMSQYCERVVTIDLHHGRLEQLGTPFDRRAFWRALGINNIDLILVRNDFEKALAVKKLKFDFAFVDGAHDSSVKNDFDLVKHCGRVLFHDYDSRGQPEQDYVYDFINTLPKSQLEVRDIFALWTDPSKRGDAAHG